MNDRIDLSIIVPIYNVENYLDECLVSIATSLNSSFSAEILCVNDGSQDGSALIAESFEKSDPRFKVIHQVNGGYGKAINTGLKAARGEFVTIVESDDVIVPNAYDVLLNILRKDSTLDFIKTPYQPFTSEGPLAILSEPPDGLRAADLLAANAPQAKTFLSDMMVFEPPAIWAGVYRRSSLERCQISLPETPGAGYQDTCFSVMCFLNRMKYHWVNDRYYMYRVDREAASRHVYNRRSEIVTLFDVIQRNLAQNGTFVEDAFPVFYAVYFRRLIWFMQRVRRDHRFTLFLEAFRRFEAVWESPALREATKALLPEGEALQFENFWQGRHNMLYADETPT